MNNNFTISFRKIAFFLFLTFSLNIAFGQQKQYKVVAYISSDSTSLMQYDLKKVTHLIYGFAHLDNEGKISINKKKDTVMLKTFAELKKASQTKNNDRFRRVDRMFYLFCNILG